MVDKEPDKEETKKKDKNYDHYARFTKEELYKMGDRR